MPIIDADGIGPKLCESSLPVGSGLSPSRKYPSDRIFFTRLTICIFFHGCLATTMSSRPGSIFGTAWTQSPSRNVGHMLSPCIRTSIRVNRLSSPESTKSRYGPSHSKTCGGCFRWHPSTLEHALLRLRPCKHCTTWQPAKTCHVDQGLIQDAEA